MLTRSNRLVPSETTQCSSLKVALVSNWEGVAKTLMLINDRIAKKIIKIYNIGVTDVRFEVEYL